MSFTFLAIVLRIAALPEQKAQLIPQPLDHRTGRRRRSPPAHTAPLRPIPNADGGQQAVSADYAGCRAGVHQQETAGAVGVLRFAGRKAGLTEQRRLLVACNAGNRDIAARQGNSNRKPRLRSTRAGSIARGMSSASSRVSSQSRRVNVEDHRACGIGRVRDVHLAAGQLPHQPGIHRAEQDFARARPSPVRPPHGRAAT